MYLLIYPSIWQTGRAALYSVVNIMMDDKCLLIQQLNENISTDFSNLNLLPDNNDIDDNPYTNVDINSNFYDYNSFKCTYANSKQPIILNINIQSLQSKFSNLKTFLLSCINDNPYRCSGSSRNMANH